MTMPGVQTRVYTRRTRRASEAGIEGGTGPQGGYPLQPGGPQAYHGQDRRFSRRSSTPNAYHYCPPHMAAGQNNAQHNNAQHNNAQHDVSWLPPSGMEVRRRRQRSATPSNDAQTPPPGPPPQQQGNVRQRRHPPPHHKHIHQDNNNYVQNRRGHHTIERDSFNQKDIYQRFEAEKQTNRRTEMQPHQQTTHLSSPHMQNQVYTNSKFERPRNVNMDRRASSSGLEAMSTSGYYWQYASHKLEGAPRTRRRRTSNPNLENMDLDEINWRTGERKSSQQDWRSGELTNSQPGSPEIDSMAGYPSNRSHSSMAGYPSDRSHSSMAGYPNDQSQAGYPSDRSQAGYPSDRLRALTHSEEIQQQSRDIQLYYAEYDQLELDGNKSKKKKVPTATLR